MMDRSSIFHQKSGIEHESSLKSIITSVRLPADINTNRSEIRKANKSANRREIDKYLKRKVKVEDDHVSWIKNELKER